MTDVVIPDPWVGTSYARPTRWKNCGELRKRIWMREITDLGPVGAMNME